MKRDLDNLVLQMHAGGMSYDEAVREFKKRFILEVLAKHRGNLSRTLAELNLDSAQIKRGLRRPVRSVRPTRPGLQIVSNGR